MRADDTQRILTEEGPQRPDGSSRVAPPARAVRKPLLWIAALICLALLAATAGEMWTLGHERQMVAQTRSENQRIARDIQQTRQAGFQKHLTKPINLQELQAAIQEVA